MENCKFLQVFKTRVYKSSAVTAIIIRMIIRTNQENTQLQSKNSEAFHDYENLMEIMAESELQLS